MLFICLFLHQTTTLWYRYLCNMCCLSVYSYIKPQPCNRHRAGGRGCLSVYSYIKPQRGRDREEVIQVVYLSIPTSNHNLIQQRDSLTKVVYLSIPTSNHNHLLPFVAPVLVVYLSIPTSNHNIRCCLLVAVPVVYLSIPTSNHNPCRGMPHHIWLFICLFLHQTTTIRGLQKRWKRLFICLFLHQTTTLLLVLSCRKQLFICLFLHQTTTPSPFGGWRKSCLSVYSYIKPQHIPVCRLRTGGCLSVYSYIKPQLAGSLA